MDRYNMYTWVLEQNKFCCETCHAQDGEKSTVTRKNVRVFVGHIDNNLDNLSRRNLQAICDVCYQVSQKQAVQAALLFSDGESRRTPHAPDKSVLAPAQAKSVKSSYSPAESAPFQPLLPVM